MIGRVHHKQFESAGVVRVINLYPKTPGACTGDGCGHLTAESKQCTATCLANINHLVVSITQFKDPQLPQKRRTGFCLLPRFVDSYTQYVLSVPVSTLRAPGWSVSPIEAGSMTKKAVSPQTRSSS